MAKSKFNKKRFTLGPWPRGINEVDSDTRVRPDECREAINFFVEDDGSLHTRPGFKGPKGSGTYYTGDYFRRMLGYAYNQHAIMASSCEGATAGVLDKYEFYVTDDTTAGSFSWTSLYPAMIIDDLPSVSIYYAGYQYFFFDSGASISGGYQVNHNTENVVNLTNMPHATPHAGLIHKDRMWVWKADTLYYSKVTDPTVWDAPDGGFIQVRPGAGGTIMQVVEYNDNLIIFKGDGMWQLYFQADPATDGVLRLMNSDKHWEGGIVIEGKLFGWDGNDVYEIKGNNVINVSTKVQLDAVWNESDLGRAGKFLQCGSYIMNTHTYAWSRWDSVLVTGRELWELAPAYAPYKNDTPHYVFHPARQDSPDTTIVAENVRTYSDMSDDTNLSRAFTFSLEDNNNDVSYGTDFYDTYGPGTQQSTSFPVARMTTGATAFGDEYRWKKFHVLYSDRNAAGARSAYLEAQKDLDFYFGVIVIDERYYDDSNYDTTPRMTVFEATHNQAYGPMTIAGPLRFLSLQAVYHQNETPLTETYSSQYSEYDYMEYNHTVIDRFLLDVSIGSNLDYAAGIGATTNP